MPITAAATVTLGVGAVVGSALAPQTVYVAPPPPVYYALLWLALLLMNDELDPRGLDLIIPDITKTCPMFFPWSIASARRVPTGS